MDEAAVMEAWGRVKGMLEWDEGELAKRLAQRRQVGLGRGRLKTRATKLTQPRFAAVWAPRSAAR